MSLTWQSHAFKQTRIAARIACRQRQQIAGAATRTQFPHLGAWAAMRRHQPLRAFAKQDASAKSGWLPAEPEQRRIANARNGPNRLILNEWVVPGKHAYRTTRFVQATSLNCTTWHRLRTFWVPWCLRRACRGSFRAGNRDWGFGIRKIKSSSFLRRQESSSFFF